MVQVKSPLFLPEFSDYFQRVSRNSKTLAPHLPTLLRCTHLIYLCEQNTSHFFSEKSNIILKERVFPDTNNT